MDYTNILKDISTYPGISGREESFSKYIKGIFDKYCDETIIDSFYNVIGIKKGSSEKSKKIMIAAHLDEIGMVVTGIEKKGFLRFSNIGGIDPKILLAQEVVVHGKKDIIGVIGAKPPHLLKDTDAKKAVKIQDLSIDTGLSEEEVKEYISIGDFVTFKAEPFLLKNKKISSKSLDNRGGVAVLIDIMEKLKKIQHECDVYFVATSQEEVGLRGATVAAYNIRPDVAVVIDACHGAIPEMAKDLVFKLGKGPAIAVGPNLHGDLTKKLIDIAKEENIPYQIEPSPGNTGTDAWAIQVSRSGIPTVLVSVPLKYMHTTVETLHLNDIKYSGKLVLKFILSIEGEIGGILCC
ncbi:M42 family metallopeptidase [Acetivibrio saccincola]|uniref:Aminopeptidase YsdC n=1 Tax=Acetivibrio saccincola TaxID=1677857 RepID=A0A2K9ELI7_9FIRM|nr:M42 family metallopeptidase [Acetivibrio saccincola]AUG57451.1 Putative aminopeptidase YsdC [Acetivibrio saccincola]NLW27357.1 M42 family metallopeptidase [Acetivibrio saccincola]HOA98230.1 M42 family metallopeptidase [Acetivibrio saccincola]HQD29405.1 M42 family metallopeptidase [Acetivibrio saccincola]